MTKKEDERVEEIDESEAFLNTITELGVSLGPLLLKNKELDAPIIKRQQLINFTIMFTVCFGIMILAYTRTIDGSAATGLLGAVIGYVFGHIYSKKDK